MEKIKVVVDILEIGALPIYDKDMDSSSLIVSESETVFESVSGSRVLAPCSPITPKLLRSMAELLERADKEGKTKVVLVVSRQVDGIGLVAV